eukprot:TRINITY_DN53159_c0_g1_i1.p1 TRINITY_DN53159_c0_g1~~TRINITY_DN53159_c0_g1_i1.p1  ORF type:complete len:118 (-),score=35.93 TRINITY_DN53159_c0_g1_i1:60-413(-)
MKGPSPSAAAAQDEVQHSRKLKRIQALQISPVTQLPMTLFMLWMVGNEIQIFSIMFVGMSVMNPIQSCLLYTSDAADEEDSVDLGGRRIIKKKKNINIRDCTYIYETMAQQLALHQI